MLETLLTLRETVGGIARSLPPAPWGAYRIWLSSRRPSGVRNTFFP